MLYHLHLVGHFLLEKLLELNYLVRLLIEYESIDFPFKLNLNFLFIIHLILSNFLHIARRLLFCRAFLLSKFTLYIIFFLPVELLELVENHGSERKGIEDVMELVVTEAVVDRQV